MIRTVSILIALIATTFFVPFWAQIAVYLIALFLIPHRTALLIPAIVADAWYSPYHGLRLEDNKMFFVVLGMLVIFTTIMRTTRISHHYGLEKK
jgi:hypothetical protein